MSDATSRWPLALSMAVLVACGASAFAQTPGPAEVRATPQNDVAAEEWPTVRVHGPFIFRADFPLEDMSAIVADLQQIHTRLKMYLQLPPIQQHIEVYLFHDKATYQAFLKSQFPQAPFRRALYIKKGNRPGMVLGYKHDKWEEDLRHEGTHALLHAALPVVPLWLDEGLAEYFEIPTGKRAHGHDHQTLAKLGAQFRVPASLKKLEEINDVRKMGATEYRNSWAWIHYLLHGDHECYEELVAYIARIAQGEMPGRLSDRLYQRMPDANARFSQHFRDWK